MRNISRSEITVFSRTCDLHESFTITKYNIFNINKLSNIQYGSRTYKVCVCYNVLLHYVCVICPYLRALETKKKPDMHTNFPNASELLLKIRQMVTDPGKLE